MSEVEHRSDIINSCGNIEILCPGYIPNICVFDAWKEFHLFGSESRREQCVIISIDSAFSDIQWGIKLYVLCLYTWISGWVSNPDAEMGPCSPCNVSVLKHFSSHSRVQLFLWHSVLACQCWSHYRYDRYSVLNITWSTSHPPSTEYI